MLQYVVRGFKKENVNHQSGSSQGFELLAEIGKKGSFTNVYNEGGPLNALLVTICGNIVSGRLSTQK